MYWLFIYASKLFVTDHHCKPWTEFTDFIANGRIYRTSCTVSWLEILNTAKNVTLEEAAVTFWKGLESQIV